MCQMVWLTEIYGQHLYGNEVWLICLDVGLLENLWPVFDFDLLVTTKNEGFLENEFICTNWKHRHSKEVMARQGERC